MPPHRTERIKDKKIRKFLENEYGKVISYSYGTNPETLPYRFLVYRITMQNEDGFTIDLTWEQIKGFC